MTCEVPMPTESKCLLRATTTATYHMLFFSAGGLLRDGFRKGCLSSPTQEPKLTQEIKWKTRWGRGSSWVRLAHRQLLCWRYETDRRRGGLLWHVNLRTEDNDDDEQGNSLQEKTILFFSLIFPHIDFITFNQRVLLGYLRREEDRSFQKEKINKLNKEQLAK